MSSTTQPPIASTKLVQASVVTHSCRNAEVRISPAVETENHFSGLSSEELDSNESDVDDSTVVHAPSWMKRFPGTIQKCSIPKENQSHLHKIEKFLR